ncbi:MAG: lipoate--protein ligase [Bacteroidales bacterium]|jgi:lipoate-protein ligase A|nr:lipoate--protein ligase [Bacteroidales bacterium]
MLLIHDITTDPSWNLAAEEYLLENFSESVFRLWRNADSIIVGRNQNAYAEIDTEWVAANGIPVVRRLSGGGAVFHDLGNVNFSFFESGISRQESNEMFRSYTKPILDALHSLGVEAYLEGRNDLVIDGKKFSGNAMCFSKDRVMQHGTLLFSASMNSLANALKERPEKFDGKAVKSHRSRVTNIAEHLSEKMDVVEFMDYLADYVGREYIPYRWSEEDLRSIESIAESKYRKDSWNFGASPKYALNKVKKFPAGLVEISFDVSSGKISALEIRGDFFFNKPVEEFCNLMCGIEHTPEKISGRLNEVAAGDYFCGISPEELTLLFF